jgi:hypothetical protein
MPDREGQAAPEWLQQLAAIVVLACCVAMAMPKRKAEVDVLTAVEKEQNAKPKLRKKKKPPPEAQEFMHLPPQVRRQVLDYARNWVDANFEKTGRMPE